MAKKVTARARTQRLLTQPLTPRRGRRKLVVGGVILVLALGIGGVMRFMRQPDLAPRVQGAVDHHYTRGSAGAPVVIKEFTDYTCPHCARLQEPLERALQYFEGQVQLVLYPFVLNPTSAVATQAAFCAGEQGKFWEFHQMLYRRQEVWFRFAAPLERLREFAAELALDPTALTRCVESGRMQNFITADQAYGQQLQVHSTPTLFINAQRVVGTQSEGELVRLIRQELDRVRPATGKVPS